MDQISGFFQGDSPALQLVREWGYTVYEERELIKMYIHLILAVLFPIYTGSHASLRRPPSAASPKKPTQEKIDADDDDEIVVEPLVEGLSPSDAVLFPLLAGTTLAVLYFIIKWLKDPAILNQILGWYFSALGVFGVGRLAADALNVATTFIFPSVWSSGDETYFVEPLLSLQVTGPVKPARTQVHRKFVGDKCTPFPGILSTIKLSKANARRVWSIRALLKNHWIFRGYVHGIFKLKALVKFNDVVGFFVGLTAVILYNYTGKAWWLTNLLGFGFCYGSLQLMSPTTFGTGSLLLAGLFVYDITMVFYTPLMVTVATTLDVPIKLVIPGPKRGSMIGLGDIVLPGIMMALALRFDLYLHYIRKQTPSGDSGSISMTANAGTEINKTVTKAPYLDAAGIWGERFWTRRAKKGDAPTVADAARFSKVYFKASLVGYVFGMLVTLVVLNVYNHAQPALLYLVPGVLVALWGTALGRGELKLMWNYTEETTSDDEEKKPDEQKTEEKSDKNKDTEEIPKSTKVSTVASSNGTDSDTIVVDTEMINKEKETEKDAHDAPIFLFSLSSPRKGAATKAKPSRRLF